MNTARAIVARQLELERAIALHRARTNFLAFIKHCFPQYAINWHHVVLARYLQRVAEGTCKRLIVSMPPRAGKSTQISVYFPAFLFGLQPRAQVIAASYNATLAARMNRSLQRVIDSPEYAEIFPDTRLNSANVRTTASGSWLRNSDEFEIVKHGGVYRSAGVGGSATGFGATLGLVDDPTRNRADADSPTYSEKIWNWFQSTMYTRLEKDGALAIVMTRWSHMDLAQRLIDQAAQDPAADQWEVINLPAIAEEPVAPYDPRKIGEPIWPEKYSLRRMLQMRATVGEREWASLYQGRPSIASGNLIQYGWWRFYKEPIRCDVMSIGVDLSFGAADGDFCAFVVMGRRGAEFVVHDLLHRRLSFVEQKQALRGLLARWPQVRTVYIEYAANAAALIDDLRRDVPGLVPVRVSTSKVARLEAVSGLIQAGNVLLPDTTTAIGKRITPTITDELGVFPSGKHDDVVDAMSLVLEQMRRKIISVGWEAESIDKPE